MAPSMAGSNIGLNTILLETITESPIEISPSKSGLALEALADS
jgi:hypothetical protein